MSSFRDRFNPEAVHYPAYIRSKVLIVVGSLLMVLSTLPTYWVEQPVEPVIIDSILLFLGLTFLWLSWPTALMTDQFGVTRHGAFLRRRKFIRWRSVASVWESHPLGPILERLGIESRMLVVTGNEGQRIVHGPRHPDRARFVHELELHGVNPRPNSSPVAKGE